MNMAIPEYAIDRSSETYRIPSLPEAKDTTLLWQGLGAARPSALLSISAGGGVSIMTDTAVIESGEQKFRQLANAWIAETGFLSDPSKKFSHRSYLKIIGMGEKVLPLILREVERMSGHWFVALDAISDANPVSSEDQTNLQRTANAWLQWGRDKGYI
ncbi:MAG: hypothetical protein ND895_23620 [Pyrinomonadaceae bacterium]|nr:hypothetical protein [Pyrinomonadaceae bacterium]